MSTPDTDPDVETIEDLRLLCLDLWDFINNHDRVTLIPDHDGLYGGLRERVIEALNLDE